MGTTVASQVSTMLRTSLSNKTELVCVVDSFAALRAVIDAGANTIRLHLPHFSEHWRKKVANFEHSGMRRAVRYAHCRGARILLVMGGVKEGGTWEEICQLLNEAQAAGINGLVTEDQAFLLYCTNRVPDLPVQLQLPALPKLERVILLMKIQCGMTKAILPKETSAGALTAIAKATALPLEIDAATLNLIAAPLAGRGAHKARFPASTRNNNPATGSTSDFSSKQHRFALAEDCCATEIAAANAGEFRHMPHAPLPENCGSRLGNLVTRMNIHGVRIDCRETHALQAGRTATIWRGAIDRICADMSGRPFAA